MPRLSRVETIGALLEAAGRPPLTNATPGHHAGFVWLREHFVFTESVEAEMPAYVSDTATNDSEMEILVKGTADVLVAPEQKVTSRQELPERIASLGTKVVGIELLDEGQTVRRGCDPVLTRGRTSRLASAPDGIGRSRPRRLPAGSGSR